jgi:hypothetical protein
MNEIAPPDKRFQPTPAKNMQGRALVCGLENPAVSDTATIRVKSTYYRKSGQAA